MTIKEVAPGTGQRLVWFRRDVLPHLDCLYSAALLMTGDQADAEVLVQDVFAAAFASFHQFRPGDNVKALLYRIMITTSAGSHPSGPPRPAQDLNGSVGDRQPTGASAPARVSPRSAAAIALDRLPPPDVRAAVRSLPEDFRIAVYLADVEGFSYREVAEITGVPIGEAVRNLHGGRRELLPRLLHAVDVA